MMKKLRKIKWENIITIALVIFEIVCMIHHIKLNGLYNGLILEVVIYSMITLTVWVEVYSIRKGC